MAYIEWLNYRNITTMTEYDRLEHHTFTVVREFDALLSALKDVERGSSFFAGKNRLQRKNMQ